MPRAPVLLVNPNRMRPPIAPVGLEYAADAVQRRGIPFTVCDATLADDWRAAVAAAAAADDWLAVAVSVRNMDDAFFLSQDFVLDDTVEVLDAVRAHTRAPIILGGIGFSMAPGPILAYTRADYGVAGDGEEALPQLLDCLAQGGDPAAVPGVAHWDEHGRPRAASYAHADLGHLPAPSRRFVDNPRYFREGGQVGVETSRGCCRRCIYCVEPLAKGPRIRTRRPAEVIKEFEDLIAQGVDVFHLCDSEFNLDYDHALALCETFAAHGLPDRCRWYAYASPALFDAALAQAAARAGCVGINFGVDHGDPAMLDRLGHGYGPGAVRQTVAACREAGLTVMYDMLFGAPGETRESLARAIALMQELDVDRVGLSCGIRVYPNTPLAGWIQAQGPLAANRHLHGVTEDNDDLLRPIFFIEAALGLDIHAIVTELTQGDPRFLHADPNQRDGNYNYNDNSVLVDAIAGGARGAYWDILRRIERAEP